MTTGPRPTPHPIILHIDDNGNPVRLAEASAIYVASAVIGTLSAINYQGLGINGGADGNEGSVQFKSNNGFRGEEGFTYNNDTFTLNVINVNITNTLSSINFRSSVVSSTNSSAVNLYATTISATTVCATNYNAALEALSFQNLDNRYLNASGDSVTGSFYLQNVSAVNLSATNYLNIPSTSAIWNASAIRGIPVTSTPPSLGESLVFKDGYWQPSAVGGGVGGTPGDPALSIQFKNGSFFSGVESIKYNSSINGIQSVTISSTNLSSTNLSSTTLRSVGVCATNISATTYQNLQEDTPKWNASKIYGTPFDKNVLLLDDFITYNGATAWKNTTKADVANLLYPLIQPQIPSGLATWNASAIRGITVTATAPSLNNVLVYNGSVWTPSSAISLATVSSTRYLGLPSGEATWNASAIRGANVLAVDAGLTTANPIGTLIYNKTNNEYLTIPFSSTILNGSRDLLVTPYQGQIVASYLGSASDYFQINPVWKTFNDIPSNKDVLVFSSSLYGLPGGGWTWEQPSALVPQVTPFGSTGQIQFKGPNGQFSSIPGILYGTDNNYLGAPNIYIPDGGTIDTPFIYSRGGGYVGAAMSMVYVSAATYNIFGKDTSSAGSPTPTSNNQTITYDSTGQKWKPGYAVYQATGIPNNSQGVNGDIYFRYIP